MPDCRTETSIINHASDIEESWLDLQSRADCSYFQSWGWIQTWLEEVANNLQPHIVKVWSDGSLVGLSLFVSRDVKRRVFFHAHAMYLNEYPFDGLNMVVEYNGVMAARGHEAVVYSETVNHLMHHFTGHDEFHFGAIACESDYGFLKRCVGKGLKPFVNEKSVCWQVDLNNFEPGLDSYLACLSRNSRRQIRRSLSLYEEMSPVKLEVAATAEQALEFFESMRGFHTKRWQSKGESGSYTNPAWVNFHQTLIQNRFEFGEIQMIRVASSEFVIAYLLNYIWQQRAYSIQMGFNYQHDKRLKPGYIAHTLAIVYNKEKGMAIYDFMHGDARYKRSLGFIRTSLFWVVLQRPRLKFFTERLAVTTARWLRGLSRHRP